MSKSPRRSTPLLKCVKPKLREMPPIARVPVNPPVNPYYLSDEWRQLREQVLWRDNHQCVIEGCFARATIVDHRQPRRLGGADTLGNLRSLCHHHHAVLGEQPDGSRKELLEKKR